MSVGRPRKLKFAIITNDDSMEPSGLSNAVRPREQPEQIKLTMGENQKHGPSNETRPIRPVKSNDIAKLSEVIKIQNKEEKRVKKENEEQRNGRLEDMRKRELEHVKNKNEEQRHVRLEDKRHRESERVKKLK